METSDKSNTDKSGDVRRSLVTLKRLNEVIAKLPSPADFVGRSTIIKVGSIDLKFEKIKYVASDGNAEYRWSYSSRIVI